jgi:hypothetical protein
MAMLMIDRWPSTLPDTGRQLRPYRTNAPTPQEIICLTYAPTRFTRW